MAIAAKGEGGVGNGNKGAVLLEVSRDGERRSM